MRERNENAGAPTATIAVLLLLGAAGSAQTPHPTPMSETFDAATPATTAACGHSGYGTYPAGWVADTVNGANIWRVDDDGTTSAGTGPSFDHTSGLPGQGNYLYTESTGCSAGTQAILVSPTFDVTPLSAPMLRFHHHMHGAGMGTLQVEQANGFGGWTTIWSLSGDQGDAWHLAQVPLTPYTGSSGNPEVQVRFVGTTGEAFTSDMALDDVSIGQPWIGEWEVNKAQCSLDFDGVVTNGFLPAIRSLDTYVATNATVQLHFRTTLIGLPFDIVYNTAPMIGRTTPHALRLPGDTVFNLDYPQGLNFMSEITTGGSQLFVPGLPLAGTSYSMTVPLALAPGTVSAQAYALDPSHPSLLALSQCGQVDVTVLPPLTTVPGPTTDDGTVTVDVGSAASGTAWCPGGFSFYGTTYSQIGVSANGRITFGAADGDLSPSLAEALQEAMVGYWTDLDVSSGGSITVAQTASGFRVDYAAVPYYGEAIPIGFGIDCDCQNGTIRIEGLGGITANPGTSGFGDGVFLGVSAGSALPASEPGLSTLFTVGSPFTPASSSDMIYDYYDGTAGTLPPSLDPGQNPAAPQVLEFTTINGGLMVTPL